MNIAKITPRTLHQLRVAAVYGDLKGFSRARVMGADERVEDLVQLGFETRNGVRWRRETASRIETVDLIAFGGVSYHIVAKGPLVDVAA